MEYKSNRLGRINQASPAECKDEISIRYSRILNNLQHFAHESVRLHADPNACYFAAQSTLQVFDMRSVLRQGAGGDDIDFRRFESLVNVLVAGLGEGETVADERTLLVGEGMLENFFSFRCHCCFEWHKLDVVHDGIILLLGTKVNIENVIRWKEKGLTTLGNFRRIL